MDQNTSEELTAEEQEAQDENAFASGYTGEDVEISDELEEDPEGEEPAEESSEEPDEESEEEPEEEPKELEDSEFDKLQSRLRNMEGKFGTLNSHLQQLLDRAEATTEKSGGDSPSSAEVKQAMASGEKFEALKEEFPEWAEAMEEVMALNRQSILDTIKVPEVENIRAQVRDEVITEIRREQVEEAHEGWEDTVKTAKFAAWMEDQDESVTRLAMSDKPRDAIRLLDLYKEYTDNSVQELSNTKDTRRESSRRRLENAVPSTKSGGASRRESGPSEEEAFEAGFNS